MIIIKIDCHGHPQMLCGLNIWMLSDTMQVKGLSNIITICTYLLLRCLLSDRCGTLFNGEISLFLLISRMLIYMFILLSITITFYGLFGNTNLVSGRFCHFGWLWALGFSTHSLTPSVPLLSQGFVIYYLLGLYNGSYSLQACWQESSNFLVLSFGLSWITY